MADTNERKLPAPAVSPDKTEWIEAAGPSMVTNIVDCDFDKLKCEQAVTVVFMPSEGGPPLPPFKLA